MNTKHNNKIPQADQMIDHTDHELMLFHIQSLFDKPIFSNHDQNTNDQHASHPTNGHYPETYEIIYEKDFTNSFLITNPIAIFSIIEKKRFMEMQEDSQVLLLERIEEILQRCSHNAYALSNNLFLGLTETKYIQVAIGMLAYKGRNNEKFQQLSQIADECQPHQKDIIMLLIQILMKQSNKDSTVTKKLQSLVKRTIHGKRFLRLHIEYIYQYLKNRCEKLCKKGNAVKAMQKVEIGLGILLNMFEQNFENGPTSYFYFSGNLYGIEMKSQKTPWPFQKGFTAVVWFSLQDQTVQDQYNLPVLFNCFSQGYGGFECYLIQNSIFYRILAKKYTPPTIESNGVFLAEIQLKKWSFFAIEYEKPMFGKSQLVAIINDKSVQNQHVDYPKFEKDAVLSMVNVCSNFTGQMSSFLLFKESVNNVKKLSNLWKTYEYGIYSNTYLTHLNTEAFDGKLVDKLYMGYCAERVDKTSVLDYINNNDAKLRINTGLYNTNLKSKIFYTGGLSSPLPILEIIKFIASNYAQNELKGLDKVVNNFLMLINQTISSNSLASFEQMNSNFCSTLFLLISKLPFQGVNSLTISLLAEIRFQIGDSKLQEDFFKYLLFSSDYWINTDNIEVINEYWSFAKAIYSQDPIHYNNIFSIQNLIDLMVKISDIKDGHCCDYHKNTYLMFYQGKSHIASTMTPIQRISKLQWPDQPQPAHFKTPTYELQKQTVPQQKIYDTDRYLSPIAGVLESVLTSGGSEMLTQVQYIAKSLIAKTSPCFHMQMLKLLKVLLVDSKDGQNCASSKEFATHFFNAKGLQILLYLCSNSSFDVKSLCIKLINVLSTYKNLIKIAYDTDLVTYLSSILLPKQMVEGEQKKNKSKFIKDVPQINIFKTEPEDPFSMAKDFESNQDEEEKVGYLKSKTQQIKFQSAQRKKNFGTGLFVEEKESSPFEVIHSQRKFSTLEDGSGKSALSNPLQVDKQFLQFDYNTSQQLQTKNKNQPIKIVDDINQDNSPVESRESNKDNQYTFTSQSQTKTQISSSQYDKSLVKNKFQLSLDTDVINQSYNNQATVDSNIQIDLNEQYEKELNELADSCLVAMSKDHCSDNESYQSSEKINAPVQDQLKVIQKSESPDINYTVQKRGSSKHQTTKSQSILIVPQYYIETMSQNKLLTIKKKKSMDELMPIGSSFDSDNISDNNLIRSGSICEKTEGTNEYTSELENLYTSCIEWALSRNPSSLYQNIVIDDFDKIGFSPALSLLMNLVSFSNNFIRQKTLQDLFMLTRWDYLNGLMLLFHSQFHNWLLDLLMPYQDKLIKEQSLEGMQLAVYDIGCKLHTLLLKNACIYSEEDVHKRLNFLARWPQIISQQYMDNIKNRYQSDIQTSHKLSRTLLVQLLSNLKDEANKTEPKITQSSPLWKNIIHLSNLLEELILGSQTFNSPLSPNFKIKQSKQTNKNVVKLIQQDYLLYKEDTDHQIIWIEWEHLEDLFLILDLIFPQTLFSKTSTNDNTGSIEQTVYNLLDRSSADDFNRIMEILMYEGQATQTHATSARSQTINKPNDQPSAQKTKSKLKGPLGLASAALQTAQSQLNPWNLAAQAITRTFQVSPYHIFMKTMLNILCVAISQASTKEQLKHWLERFQRYVKFLMIVSEIWKSRHISNYNLYQRRFSETITVAFAFLFNEIHESNLDSENKLNIYDQSTLNGLIQLTKKNGSCNNHRSQNFSKYYAKALKNIMIYYINIIEYSQIRFTPSQLEATTHITACRYIFNNVLVKHQPDGGLQNLLTLADIKRIKQNEYAEFPQSFYQDEWKNTFYQSDQIKQMAKKQLSYITIDKHREKRKEYAIKIIQTYQRSDKTKDKILKKVQNDTLEVISNYSEVEFERKNKTALLCENLSRYQMYQWKKAKKKLCQRNGVWKEIGDEFLKSSLTKNSEGIRAFMSSRVSNGFIYIKDNTELEKKIFKEISNKDHNNVSDFNDQENLSKLPIKSNYISPRKSKSLILQSAPCIKENIFIQSEIKEKEEKQLKLDDDSNENEEEFSPSEDDNSQEEDLRNLGSQFETKEVPIQSESAQIDIMNDKIQSQKPLIQFFSRTLSTREKISLKKSYINHLRDYVFTFRPKGKEISEFKCSILKPLYQRPGQIVITGFDLIFFDELYLPTAANQETDNIFFFKYAKAQDHLLYKIIPLNDIKEMQKRRFLGKKCGLEIFLMNGSSQLLYFENNDDREHLVAKILKHKQSKSENLKYYGTLEAKKLLKKKELTEKWLQYKISNFEYLMQLNFLAGRSFNDLSQYPVFPWLFTDYISDVPPDILSHNQLTNAEVPIGFRDLNKNMQLLGTAERQADFKRKYEDTDNYLILKDRFHCGSHYSNPGIVLHYLTRVSPYIDAYVELHGKNLDKPDRTFCSVQDSLYSALTDHSDVREIIPEFFFMPEMYLNLNKVNYGVKQDGKTVSDVILPQWSNYDPYNFVMYMREAMESPYVSQNLGGWIDYIFGFKQKDVEAEKCLNIYANLTYEDAVNLETMHDEVLKNSYKLQIYNYGQTPSQLFSKNQKHPNKSIKQSIVKYNYVCDTITKLKVYKPVSSNTSNQQAKTTVCNSNNQLLISKEAIIQAKFQDDATIFGLCKDGTIIVYKWYSKNNDSASGAPFTCSEDHKRKVDSRSKVSGVLQQVTHLQSLNMPLAVLCQGRSVIYGGYWDGKLMICPFDNNSADVSKSINVHQATVTAIASTMNEKIIITGSKLGDIIIWNHNWNSQQTNVPWQIRQHLCDHHAQVTSIHINEEMNMYVTGSIDGTANVYNLWNDKYLRTFQHPSYGSIDTVILTQTPLAAICFLSYSDQHWYSFSINGHFLGKQSEDYKSIVAAQVIKDSYFMDKLVYGTEKGNIIFRQLPLLKIMRKHVVSNNHPVISILATSDKRYLLVGCGDGGLNIVTDPN